MRAYQSPLQLLSPDSGNPIEEEEMTDAEFILTEFDMNPFEEAVTTEMNELDGIES